eukprot:3484142-Alexandrium_andersonii.AAC.1
MLRHERFRGPLRNLLIQLGAIPQAEAERQAPGPVHSQQHRDDMRFRHRLQCTSGQDCEQRADESDGVGDTSLQLQAHGQR